MKYFILSILVISLNGCVKTEYILQSKEVKSKEVKLELPPKVPYKKFTFGSQKVFEDKGVQDLIKTLKACRHSNNYCTEIITKHNNLISDKKSVED